MTYCSQEESSRSRKSMPETEENLWGRKQIDLRWRGWKAQTNCTHFIGERKWLRLNSQLYRFEVMWKYKLVGSCSLRRQIFYLFIFLGAFVCMLNETTDREEKTVADNLGGGSSVSHQTALKKKCITNNCVEGYWANEAFVKQKLCGLPANN